MNNQQKLMLGGAIAIVAVVVIVRQADELSAPPATRQAWFVDLTSGELFADDYGRHPPFASPTGGEAVRAHVYAVNCTDVRLNDIAYISRYNDAALAELAKPDERRRFDIIEMGELIAVYPSDGEPNWQSAISGEAERLKNTAAQRGNPCLP